MDYAALTPTPPLSPNTSSPFLTGDQPRNNDGKDAVISEPLADSEVPGGQAGVLDESAESRESRGWIRSSWRGVAIQRLLLRNSNGELSDMEVCESSHEFIGRPATSLFLKYVLGPAVMALQFTVFVAVYGDYTVISCTDYSIWDQKVKLGLPLAIGYISAEIAAQIVRILRLLCFGVYAGSPWSVIGSLCMMAQTAFEILVYSSVIGSSTSIEDLIQNFVALAVTNEADDKVAKIISVRGAKSMFLDNMEEHEWCPLSRESDPPPTNLWAFFQGFLCRPGRRSISKANYFRWVLNNTDGWPLRCVLFTAMCALITWIALILVERAIYSCDFNNVSATGVLNYGTVYHGLPPASSTLYGWLEDQNLTYAQFFTNASIVSFAGSDAPYEFDLRMPNGFPFGQTRQHGAGRYYKALLFPHGYIELTEYERAPGEALDAVSTGSIIAPFFAHLDVTTGTVYAATVEQDFMWMDNLNVSYIYTRSSVVIVFDRVGYAGMEGPLCNYEQIADGFCNPENNIESCAWDGGDCCASTCGRYKIQDFLGATYTLPKSYNPPYGVYCDTSHFHEYCLQSKQDIFFAKNDLLLTVANSSYTMSFEVVLADDGRVRISYPEALRSDAFTTDSDFTIGLAATSCRTKRNCAKFGIGSGDSIYAKNSDLGGDFTYTALTPSSFALHPVDNCTGTSPPCIGPECECIPSTDFIFPPEFSGGSQQGIPMGCSLGDDQLTQVYIGCVDTLGNSAACDYFGGRCCASTCTDSPEYTCKNQRFDHCIDPCAIETSGYAMCPP